VVDDLEIRYPFILINFKTYLEAQGKNAVNLGKVIGKVSKEYGVCMGAAPQYVDLPLVISCVDIPVFSQHLDPDMPGSRTGSVLPESLKEKGVCGTILNHSERRLQTDVIEKSIERCRVLGLSTCICANTSAVGKALAALNPDMIAVEPPELIGSGVSVSRAKPEVIENSVKMVKAINEKVHILCGAGITGGEDVAAALQLGSEGVLVASGVVKAKDPEMVLKGFALKATRS
jgi:triosephosphate isomerase